MSDIRHIKADLFASALDGELTTAEQLAVQQHLEQCSDCMSRYSEMRTLTEDLDKYFGCTSDMQINQRSAFLSALGAQDQVTRSKQAGRTRVIALTTAAASALLVGLWLHTHGVVEAGVSSAVSAVSRSSIPEPFDIYGETFMPLPYSNTDLPIGSPHVVRMYVPVTSLADAGLMYEPVSKLVTNEDRPILADVLLGVDGEPLGVHILE